MLGVSLRVGAREPASVNPFAALSGRVRGCCRRSTLVCTSVTLFGQVLCARARAPKPARQASGGRRVARPACSAPVRLQQRAGVHRTLWRTYAVHAFACQWQPMLTYTACFSILRQSMLPHCLRTSEASMLSQGSLQGGTSAGGRAGSGGGRDDVEAGAASEQCAPAPPAPALGPAPGRPPWQEPALRQRAARRGAFVGSPSGAEWGDLRQGNEAAQSCQEAEAEAGASGRLGGLAGRAGR